MNEIKNVPKNRSVTLRNAEKTSNNRKSRDSLDDDIYILSLDRFGILYHKIPKNLITYIKN